MSHFCFLLGWLIFLHLLLDYPLQADFMAKAKNHLEPVPGVPWALILISHTFMQAFAVYIVTANVACFILEFVTHTVFDFLRCNKTIPFGVDQGLHVLMKLFYVCFILTIAK